MKHGYYVLIVALASALHTKATPVSMFSQANLDSSLAQYVLQGNPAVVAANPAITAQCFAIYLPQLTQVADDYSTQYEACIKLANIETADANTQASSERVNVSSTSGAMCSVLQSCDTDTDVITFFNCLATAASEDVSALYKLSTDAAKAANALTLGLQTVQQDLEACKNATQRTYVTSTAMTYQQLDECLENGPSISSTSEPATTTSEAAATTTDVASAALVEAVAFATKTQCLNDSGTNTQTSADSSQTQTQTGPGCQSQSSGNGTAQSQSQSGAGNGTQSQCSGTDCGKWKPLFTMAPMEPMAPMKPMEPMPPMKPMEPMAPMKPMEPMAPMKPLAPMAPMPSME